MNLSTWGLYGTLRTFNSQENILHTWISGGVRNQTINLCYCLKSLKPAELLTRIRFIALNVQTCCHAGDLSKIEDYPKVSSLIRSANYPSTTLLCEVPRESCCSKSAIVPGIISRVWEAHDQEKLERQGVSVVY